MKHDIVIDFIIPVQHQNNVKDWNKVKSNLTQTAKSISNQIDGRWRARIVANYGADIPDLPNNFSVTRVDFSPNPLYDLKSSDLDAVYHAVRFDKGRRILAGLLESDPKSHIMLVDDDDFVSRHLTEFVANHRDENGWFIKDGYAWGEGGQILYKLDYFSDMCGSSHIVRADLLNLPSSLETATMDFIQHMLGSHVSIRTRLEQSGTPLAPLPFNGAVYRIGHGSHSQSSRLFRQFFYRRLILEPRELAHRVLQIRPLTSSHRREFFGQHD